jgi:CRP-like cAMP-binding protein
MIGPASIQFFTGLQTSEIDIVVAAAVRRKFQKPEIISRADEPAASLFLIKLGSVNFQIARDDGEQILLRRLVPGDICGVASLLSEPTRNLGTTQAVNTVEILAWDHRSIRRLARMYPRLAENALRTALRYVALYAKRHIGLVSNTAQERLACALASMGSRAGHVCPSGIEVDIKNEELASLADVNVFTASRLLKNWERKGLVEKSRGRFLIRRPEHLVA